MGSSPAEDLEEAGALLLPAEDLEEAGALLLPEEDLEEAGALLLPEEDLEEDGAFKDKALLLQHFQTVGIHEGRQGCEGFNVAAYQKNCDAKLREAFGDQVVGVPILQGIDIGPVAGQGRKLGVVFQGSATTKRKTPSIPRRMRCMSSLTSLSLC